MSRKVVRNGAPDAVNSVYVGRPTFLGNPYVIGPDGSRDEVVQKYAVWFQGQAQDAEFAQRVREYCTDKDLACWCAPLSCHAEIIARFLDPPDNPTECDMYFKDGAWRVWCEVDLAGPCSGCPEETHA